MMIVKITLAHSNILLFTYKKNHVLGCSDLMRDATWPSAGAAWGPQNLLLSHKLSSNICNGNLLLFIMTDATGVVYLDIIFSLAVFINKCLQVLWCGENYISHDKQEVLRGIALPHNATQIPTAWLFFSKYGDTTSFRKSLFSSHLLPAIDMQNCKRNIFKMMIHQFWTVESNVCNLYKIY